MEATLQIFCPNNHLMLTAPRCPECGWARPVSGEAGEPAWGPIHLGVELGGPGRGMPAVAAAAQGVAVYALRNGELLGLSLADGTERWRTVLHAGMMTRHLVTDGAVLLASIADERQIGTAQAAQLVAIHPKNGKITLLWEAGGHQLTPPVLTRELILLWSASHDVVALRRRDFSVAWRRRMNTWWSLPPYVAGETVLVCDGRAMHGEGELVALDLHSGAFRWRTPLLGMLGQMPAALGETLIFINGRKQLAGLDLRTGEIRWQHDFKRIYSAPAAGEDLVFLATRGPGGSGEAGHYQVLAFDAAGNPRLEIPLPPNARARYARVHRGTLYLGTDDGRILACNTADGALQWTFDFHPGESNSLDKIHTNLLIEGDLLVAGTYLGQIAALHLAASTPERQSPQDFLKAGQFEEAAAAFVWEGDLRRAAEIYIEQLGDREKAIALYEHLGDYQSAGELARDLGQYGRAGEYFARAGDQIARAEMLEKSGDLIGAAEIYAQANALVQAGELYEKAGEYHKAGQMYVRLGSLTDVLRVKAKSTINWLTSRDIEALKEHADPQEVGELAMETGMPVKAAKLFEQAGARARQLDALLLVVAEHPDEEWAWDTIEGLASALNRLPEAGEAARAAGDLPRAAAFFRQAGDSQRELEIWQTLVNRDPHNDTVWDRIAKLARSLGQFELEAQAWVHFQHLEDAAYAYWRAALQAERVTPEGQERIAGLFERAQGLFDDLGMDEESRECQAKITYYRKLPFVVVEGRTQKAFREGKFSRMTLTITNAGYGTARNVRVRLAEKRFELGETSLNLLIKHLYPNRPRTKVISLRPYEDQVGDAVPLTLEWMWEDQHGREYREQSVAYVQVKDREASHTGGSPQVVHYHGPVYQSDSGIEITQGDRTEVHGDLIQGDNLQAGAQKGDRVEIQRGEGIRLRPRTRQTGPLSPDEVLCPNCHLPIRPGDKFCDGCGWKMEDSG